MSSKFKFSNSKDVLQNDYVHNLREEYKQKKLKNLQSQDVIKYGIKMRSPPIRKAQSQDNFKGLDLSNIQKLMEVICKNQTILIQTQKPPINQIKTKNLQQNLKLQASQFRTLLIQTIQNINDTLIKSQDPIIQELKKKLNSINQNANQLSASFSQQLKQISENFCKTLSQRELYFGQIKKTFESFNSKKTIQIKEKIIEQNRKNTSSKNNQQQILMSHNKSNNKLRKSKKSSKTKFQHEIYLSQADPKDQIIDFSLDDYQFLNYTIVRQFFVQVCERILSKGHYNYIKDVFSKQDAKNYCTKNILYNVKKVIQLRPIWNKNNQIIEENPQYPQQKTQLTIENINKLLKQIADANLKRYPQKVASAVSQRVLQVVPKTNLLQSDQYDFLFLNKINITHNAKPNYFSQIMETINKMIQIPSLQIDPLVQSTYFDIFREVLNIMVVYSTSQVAKEQQSKKLFKKMKKQKKQRINKRDLYSEHINQTIQNLLVQKLRKQLEEMDLSEKKIIQKIEQILKIKIEQRNNSQEKFNLQEIKQDQLNFKNQYQKSYRHNYQNYLNDDKVKQNLNNLYANSKIFSQVKKFTQSQVKEGQLEINDSTILRILTKWAEQLQQKFKEPQNKILKRTEPFKNNQFGLTDIQQMEAEPNQLYSLLTKVLKEKFKNSIQKFLQIVKQQNQYYQLIFGQEAIKGVYINDLVSNISLFGAKMQKFSGHYILNYLNFLIHQLTEVPSKLLQNQIFKKKKNEKGQAERDLRKDLYNQQAIGKIKNINLITLKIGDLMRGKYSCSQVQFIRLVNIMENFSRQNPNLMKIIRVKNRLESKDNDILINILFMNKIQCEFQLSLSTDHSLQMKKQKKTNEFNHYLYEISRSLLGPISQLTGILIQEDPLTKDYFAKNLVNFKKISFFPINYEKDKNKQQYKNYSDKKLKEAEYLLFNQNIKSCKNILPFQCQNKNCRQIILLNNDINFQVKKKICLECSINELLRKDQQNNKQKGFSLIKKFTTPTQSQITQIQNEKQLVYDQYFQYFDHGKEETFQKVVTIDDLLHVFPKVGCFINIKQKKPQIKLFLTQKLNEQIFVFSPNQADTQLKSLNKKGSFNLDKVKILGKIKVSDKENIKNLSKIIPKTQVMWGFKDKIFEQGMIKKLSFLNIPLMKIEFNSLKLKKFQQNLTKTINLQFMQNLLIQRKSSVNINRFAKLSNTMLNVLFKNLQKDISYIKQFRANKSIYFQNQPIEDKKQKNQKNQIQNEDNISSSLVSLFVKQKPNNQYISWLNGFLTIQRLDIKSNNLTKFYLQILLQAKSEHLKKLKHLQISSNKIGLYMPSINFQNLIALQILKCSDNQIVQIQTLQSLRQLKQVDFSKNKLSNCQFVKYNLSLITIDLSNNKISQISCLKQLTKLKKLNLSENRIWNIQVCQNFFDLKDLNLAKNLQIKKLQYLSELLQLQNLNIQYCYKALDINLQKCIKLKTINFGFTRINSNINQQIKNMKELRQISFSNCKSIECLQIIQQTKLKRIDLKNAKFKKVTIVKQQLLEELFLWGCQIKQQGKLQDCSNLKFLDLSRQSQQQLKLKIKNCKNVKKLEFHRSQKNQSELEQILQQFPNLQNLSLFNSQKVFQIKIENRHIKILDLAFLRYLKQSNLESILQNLPQLQELHVNSCQKLQNIKIKNCKNIKVLNLSWTKLNQSDLQQILQQLSHLQNLEIQGCENLQSIRIKNNINIKKLNLKNTKAKQYNLQDLPQLSQLRLSNCLKIQKLSIKNCKNINYLEFSQTKFIQTYDFEQILQQLPKLQNFDLSWCENFQNIKVKKCKNIKKLKCIKTKIKQLDLDQIQQLPKLEELNLYSCTDLQKIKIRNCRNIKILFLNNTKLKVNQLDQILEQLPELQKLNLGGSEFVQDIIKIKNKKKIKILQLMGTKTKQFELQQLPQLQVINYSQSKSMTIRNCKNIKILKMDCQNLILQQLLQLQDLLCKNFQSIRIKNCKNLIKLNLNGSKILQSEFDQILPQISPLCQQLNLSKCLNLQSFKKIKDLKKIRILTLNETKIQQCDLQQITKQLVLLQQLKLNKCQSIQSVHFTHSNYMKMIELQFSSIKKLVLSQLPQFEYLNVSKCKELPQISIKNCKHIKNILFQMPTGKFVYQKYQKLAQYLKGQFPLAYVYYTISTFASLYK